MFILDVQGFQFGEDFLCKEIAIIQAENGWYEHRIVKLPSTLKVYAMDFQKQCAFLTENIHGLEWEKNGEGTIDYTQLSEFITNSIGYKSVYVKGNQKKQWLQSIIKNEVYDLQEEEQCPSFEQLKLYLRSFHCNKHSHRNDLNCALENVFFLKNWYTYCRK